MTFNILSWKHIHPPSTIFTFHKGPLHRVQFTCHEEYHSVCENSLVLLWRELSKDSKNNAEGIIIKKSFLNLSLAIPRCFCCTPLLPEVTSCFPLYSSSHNCPFKNAFSSFSRLLFLNPSLPPHARSRLDINYNLLFCLDSPHLAATYKVRDLRDLRFFYCINIG